MKMFLEDECILMITDKPEPVGFRFSFSEQTLNLIYKKLQSGKPYNKLKDYRAPSYW